MDDWTDTDDSCDEQDLEFALYSQIHFDSASNILNPCTPGYGSTINTSYFLPPSNFICLGEEETSLKKKDPIFSGDFISLSEKQDVASNVKLTSVVGNVPDYNEANPDNITEKSHAYFTGKEVLHSIIDKSSNQASYSKDSKLRQFDFGQKDEKAIVLNKVTGRLKDTGDKTLHKNAGNLKSEEILNTQSFSMNSKEVQKKKKSGIVAGALTKGKTISTLKSKTREKKTPSLFTVTKFVNKNMEREDISSCTKVKSNDLQMEIADREKTKQKWQDFIKVQMGTQFKKKKKSLTKQEAAVKPRPPPIRLRRPAKVNVYYAQDSDTNTDYSDSEASSLHSTPDKKKEQRSEVVRNNRRKRDLQEIKKHNDLHTRDSMEIEAESRSSTDHADDILWPKGKKVLRVILTRIEDEGALLIKSESSDVEEQMSVSSEDSSEDMNNIAITMAESNLEFNISGGVNALLKEDKINESSISNWYINDQDRYNMTTTTSRYFSEKKIQCRNCQQDGHLSRDCPAPLRMRCAYCSETGHSYKMCPMSVCYNCQAPGHSVKECSQSRRNPRSECRRCWMPGHHHSMCPDRWRQYYLTTRKGKIQQPKEPSPNVLVCCYNCGRKEHLGFECQESRMNPYVVVNYPFIAEYDTKRQEGKSKKKDCHQNCKSPRGQDHSPIQPKRKKKNKDQWRRSGGEIDLVTGNGNISRKRKWPKEGNHMENSFSHNDSFDKEQKVSHSREKVSRFHKKEISRSHKREVFRSHGGESSRSHERHASDYSSKRNAVNSSSDSLMSHHPGSRQESRSYYGQPSIDFQVPLSNPCTHYEDDRTMFVMDDTPRDNHWSSFKDWKKGNSHGREKESGLKKCMPGTTGNDLHGDPGQDQSAYRSQKMNPFKRRKTKATTDSDYQQSARPDLYEDQVHDGFNSKQSFQRSSSWKNPSPTKSRSHPETYQSLKQSASWPLLKKKEKKRKPVRNPSGFYSQNQAFWTRKGKPYV